MLRKKTTKIIRNLGLMVIYHDTIRKKSPTKTNPRISKIPLTNTVQNMTGSPSSESEGQNSAPEIDMLVA